MMKEINGFVFRQAKRQIYTEMALTLEAVRQNQIALAKNIPDWHTAQHERAKIKAEVITLVVESFQLAAARLDQEDANEAFAAIHSADK